MAKNNNIKDFTKDIADAIRAKENSVAKINPQDFSARITALSVGGSPKFAELVDGSITSVEANDLKDVESIASHTFMFKQNLVNVEIPSNVKSIGELAFMGTSVETLILAEGIETISNSAFSTTNIQELVLPSSLINIGEGAFADIYNLEKVTIKSGITNLPNRLFDSCENLTEVYMESSTPPSVGVNTFPSTAQIYVLYGAYDDYVASWTDYASQIVRLPAIPSTITVIVNDYTGALVSGASVTISGNGQTYTGTTDGVGTFTQGDLQPATYTISVADMEGFKTPEASEVVVEEDTQNSVTVTYLEKPAFSTVFGENSPKQISAISAEISANNMTSAQVAETYGWNIGDTTTIPLSTGENIEMRIIGFNHDDKSDGSGKAGITLEMTHCLTDDVKGNWKNDNTGGYRSMDMALIISNKIYNFPQEWQDVIVLVDKLYVNGGTSGYRQQQSTSRLLFALSAVELKMIDRDAFVQSPELEGTTYEYWSDKGGSSYKIKTSGMSSDSKANWWLRSCAKNTNMGFGYVNTSGILQTQSLASTAKISFAFCI